MNKNFWKGRKALITDHTRFKWSWLSIWLQHLEADVIGISLDPTIIPNLYSQVYLIKDNQSMRRYS